MSDPLSLAPRRIVPWTGPFAWTPAEVPAREWMIPVGAEVGAELLAEGPTPRLDALAADLAARLDHGRGFAVLRGWPAADDPGLAPAALARRIGTPVPPAPEPGARHREAADAVLLRASEAASVTIRSAAALHNALLRADRGALAALYDAPAGGMPVFASEGGVAAARWDEAVLPAAAAPALAAAAADPAGALILELRAGDILALNPFLVWATPLRGTVAAAARTVPSRLDAPGFAALR